MNKILRNSLVAAFALIANVSFAQDAPQTPTCEDIATFKTLSTRTTVTLNLKDAQVLYMFKNGSTTQYYVRDASGAVMFYNIGLNLEVGQILNGSIEATYNVHRQMPSADKTANTVADKLTITNGTAKPKEVTLADLQDEKYLCDLVSVSNVNITNPEGQGSFGSFFLESEGLQLMLIDNFRMNLEFAEEEGVNSTGIFVKANMGNGYQLGFAPISEFTKEDTNGINQVSAKKFEANAPVYNLAGQKVSSAFKGIVIKNGKKYIQ